MSERVEFEIVKYFWIELRNSEQDDNQTETLLENIQNPMKTGNTVQISTSECETYISNIKKKMTNSITSLNHLDYASVALCCTFTQNLDNPYTVRITQCWQHVSVTSRTKCLYSLLDVGINSKPVQ